MQFSDIQNKVIEPKVIELLGEKVEVKQYLPMQDKMNILEMVIQTADAGTILNTLVLDAVFEMYLIFKYTNIEFTEEEKKNILETYDKLEINDMIIPIISNIPETEYKLLRDNLLVMIDDYKSYRNSAKGCLDTFAIFAPNNLEKIEEGLVSLDMDKMKNVVNIATNAGFQNK